MKKYAENAKWTRACLQDVDFVYDFCHFCIGFYITL